MLTGIPLAGGDAASKSFLGELLNVLEKEKGAMSTFSKGEHWTICRKVADRVFDKADSEDRAGLADKGTAKTFYAAGTFYEILQQFYEKDADDAMKEKIEEEEQKRVYCKWKATDILNAIKEGRDPAIGGYQQQQAEEEEQPVGGSLDSANVPDSAMELPPAPDMPADLFMTLPKETNTLPDHPDQTDIVPPPSYDNIEVNLNGHPVVEDVQPEEESDDIFIPGPLKAAANSSQTNPPSSSAKYHETTSTPPPAPSSTLPIPLPPTTPPKSSVFSLFGSKSTTAKYTKNQLADAIELTKFALAALQKGEGELGKERLEQALSVLRR